MDKAKLKALLESELARRKMADPRGRWHKYIPAAPFEKQWEFINAPERQIFLEGGAGGAKSWAALMRLILRAEQEERYIWIIRRHLKDMKSTNGIYWTAKRWFQGTEVKEDKGMFMFEFPNGSVMQFLACDHASDWEKIQGNSANDIHVEEGPQFEPEILDLLPTRLRKRAGQTLPTCLTYTGNPGGRSHDYFRENFVEEATRIPGARDIHVTYLDNPGIDQEDYRKNFELIKDPVLRAQQEHGDWSAKSSGRYARRTDFQFLTPEEVPPMLWQAVGYDIALTNDGDPWAKVRMTSDGDRLIVLYAEERGMEEPEGREWVLKSMREAARPCLHAFENQALTLPTVQNLLTNHEVELAPWDDEESWQRIAAYADADAAKLTAKTLLCKVPAKGKKLEKAALVFEALWDRKLFLMRGEWNDWFIDRFVHFMNVDGDRDDAIDAAGNAARALMKVARSQRRRTLEVPLVPGSPAYYEAFFRANTQNAR